jgi:hypothetical protein
MHRLRVALLMVVGSFCVYCAQDVVGGMNGGGRNGGVDGGGGSSSGGGSDMVGTAGADTCCTPPDPAAGTVLFDQKFTPTTLASGYCVSPAIDVAGNRTLVVHAPATSVYTNIAWSFGGAASWSLVATGSIEVNVLDGRLGKQVQFVYGQAGSTGCPQKALTVVGYKQ